MNLNDENNRQNAVETNQAPPTNAAPPSEQDAAAKPNDDGNAPNAAETDQAPTADEQTPSAQEGAAEPDHTDNQNAETPDQTPQDASAASEAAEPDNKNDQKPEAAEPEKPDGENAEPAKQAPAKAGVPVIKRRQHYFTNLPDVGLDAQPLTAPWQQNEPQDAEGGEDDYDYPDGYKPEPAGKVAMAIAITAAAIIAAAVLAFMVYIVFDSGIFDHPSDAATVDSAPASTAVTEAVSESVEDKIVTIPDLEGLKESEAYKLLNAAEVQYKVVRITSEDVPFNYVVSQNPSAYETFPRSRIATIYISKGGEYEIIKATTRPRPSSVPTSPTVPATTVSVTSSPSNQDYLLPDSARRELSRDELKSFDRDTLNLALNEIFARHGRKFSDPDINAYFSSKSWYHPTIAAKDFDVSILNRYENYNINLITNYQSEMGYR